jgi:hypothetical protein
MDEEVRPHRRKEARGFLGVGSEVSDGDVEAHTFDHFAVWISHIRSLEEPTFGHF